MIDEPLDLPALTPEIVVDNEETLLAAAVDAVILADPEAQKRAREICEHMTWLMEAVDDDVWRLVLEIEARVNERGADLAVTIARWAFNEGRRFPLPPDVDVPPLPPATP